MKGEFRPFVLILYILYLVFPILSTLLFLNYSTKLKNLQYQLSKPLRAKFDYYIKRIRLQSYILAKKKQGAFMAFMATQLKDNSPTKFFLIPYQLPGQMPK